MKVRAKFSVSTGLAVLVTVAAVWGLFRYGKADYAVGAAAVGALLSGLLPALLSAKDRPVELKLGKSDPPRGG